MDDRPRSHRVASLAQLWNDDEHSDGGITLAEHDGGPAWYARTPNGLVANLHAHDVTVIDDDTITVDGQILVASAGGIFWHGTLTGGVWEEIDSAGRAY